MPRAVKRRVRSVSRGTSQPSAATWCLYSRSQNSGALQRISRPAATRLRPIALCGRDRVWATRSGRVRHPLRRPPGARQRWRGNDTLDCGRPLPCATSDSACLAFHVKHGHPPSALRTHCTEPPVLRTAPRRGPAMAHRPSSSSTDRPAAVLPISKTNIPRGEKLFPGGPPIEALAPLLRTAAAPSARPAPHPTAQAI